MEIQTYFDWRKPREHANVRSTVWEIGWKVLFLHAIVRDCEDACFGVPHILDIGLSGWGYLVVTAVSPGVD